MTNFIGIYGICKHNSETIFHKIFINEILKNESMRAALWRRLRKK